MVFGATGVYLYSFTTQFVCSWVCMAVYTGKGLFTFSATRQLFVYTKRNDYDIK